MREVVLNRRGWHSDQIIMSATSVMRLWRTL
jgi:hypothetical protein